MATIAQSSISLSILLLATSFTLSFAQNVNPFCKSADDKVFCTQVVRGAKTWAQAMSYVLSAELTKVKAGKGLTHTVGSRLPKNINPVTKKSIQGTCNEEYHENADNLRECIGHVRSDPSNSLKFKLSAVTVTDCVDALAEFGFKVPEVTQYAKDVLKLTGTALAILDEKPKQ